MTTRMHIITFKALRRFWADHPDAELPLRAWHDRAEKARWRNFAEVRADFSAADRVGKLTVFNVGGNKYRLIAAIHFDRQRVFVRAVLTHRDYDKGQWKED